MSKKLIFKGTINGKEFDKVEEYNAFLKKCLDNGDSIQCTSETKTVDDEAKKDEEEPKRSFYLPNKTPSEFADAMSADELASWTTSAKGALKDICDEDGAIYSWFSDLDSEIYDYVLGCRVKASGIADASSTLSEFLNKDTNVKILAEINGEIDSLRKNEASYNKASDNIKAITAGLRNGGRHKGPYDELAENLINYFLKF